MKIIEEPTNCPACDFHLEKVNDQLFCRNIHCTAQVAGKILHFAKVLNIKGLGPKTLEKLELDHYTELYFLDEQETLDRLGVSLGTKLLKEIDQSRKITLAKYIEAASIPLVGGTYAEKLAGVITNLDEISEPRCKEAGLGEKVTANIMEWKRNEYPQIKDFLPFTFDNKSEDTSKHKKVCITGKLNNYPTKAKAEGILKEYGYILVDSITKDVSYLINENNTNSSKVQKALSYGIPIVTKLEDILRN